MKGYYKCDCCGRFGRHPRYTLKTTTYAGRKLRLEFCSEPCLVGHLTVKLVRRNTHIDQAGAA